MPRELTDVPWTVAFKDGHRVVVGAAYPTTTESGTTTITSGVLWLKDANHKTVFAAPLTEIQYARRALVSQSWRDWVKRVTLLLPPNWTPEQKADFEERCASLYEAADPDEEAQRLAGRRTQR